MFLNCFSGGFFFLSIFYFHSFWNPPHVLYRSCSILIAAVSLQSCPTLCDPMDCSLPGFSIPGIFQARTLEWVAISFSNAWKRKVKVKLLSRVWLLVTPWTAAHQAPPSGIFRATEKHKVFRRIIQMIFENNNLFWGLLLLGYYWGKNYIDI